MIYSISKYIHTFYVVNGNIGWPWLHDGPNYILNQSDLSSKVIFGIHFKAISHEVLIRLILLPHLPGANVSFAFFLCWVISM